MTRVLTMVWMAGTALVTAAEWSLDRAVEHLDARQKLWSEWKPAQAQGGPCVSCHTGLPYAAARAAARRSRGEAQATELERGLAAGLEARLRSSEPVTMFPFFQKEPAKSQSAAVEAVIAVFVLSQTNAPAQAVERMWSHQIKDSEDRGAWPWFHLKLDPWESENSAYYGASLAAIALGGAPPSEGTGAMHAYLRRERERQPLHNQLMALWASARAPSLLDARARTAIREAVLRGQRSDGGLPLSALGPWSFMRDGLDGASNAYATAFAAYALRQVPGNCGDRRIERALEWLRVNQNRETGAWTAPTMTKAYPAGSMQESFMSDAASAFAVLALLDETCRASAGTAVPYPADYRSWTVVKTTLVGPQSRQFAARGGFHHFYANAKAMEGYRTGKFPDGAVIVDEGVHAVERDGNTIEGDWRGIDVMHRDSKAFTGTGGWGYEQFGEGNVARSTAGLRIACHACHSRAKNSVFSSFRK